MKTSDILGSFYDNKHGMSARKLTAFTLTLLVVAAHAIYFYALYNEHKWATDLFVEDQIVLLLGAAFFLGLITFAQILKFKNNDTANNTTAPITDHSDSSVQTN